RPFVRQPDGQLQISNIIAFYSPSQRHRHALDVVIGDPGSFVGRFLRVIERQQNNALSPILRRWSKVCNSVLRYGFTARSRLTRTPKERNAPITYRLPL